MITIHARVDEGGGIYAWGSPAPGTVASIDAAEAWIRATDDPLRYWVRDSQGVDWSVDFYPLPGAPSWADYVPTLVPDA